MLLTLDFSAEEPIYVQIRNQIVTGIADGELLPGERLPTIRALALEAGVNTMTVNKAYALLKQEGYIVADRRSGATISVAPRDGVLCAKSLNSLSLIVAEAKLAGISAEEFISICKSKYEGGAK